MRKINYFLLICLSLFSVSLQAQISKKKACGTISGRSEWLKTFQKSPSSFRTNNEETLYVPLSIHILGSDSGAGYFSLNRLHRALCTLNDDFSQANIFFYIKGDIHYIPDSKLFKHDSVKIGGRMMLANNIPESINCYIVDDPAGNCGYSLPYGGVALAISCISPSDHTWSHEIGHYCSLPHPFLGWEGGISWDNSIKPKYNKPAPEFVLYNYTDFKNQYFEQDTLIIDTALVEKVDGSNCHISADGFCDTKPDYLNFRWQCDKTSMESSTVQLDPDSVAFHSDATLIMSYATDDCANRFSPEQIAAMRANIIDVKKYFSYEDQIDVKTIDAPTTAISPIDEAIVPYKNIRLEWTPIKNADEYIVQVSRYKTFSNLSENITTSDPFVTIDHLKKEKKYYWRVLAYSNFSFCGDFSETAIFKTSALTANQDILNKNGISITPTLVHKNQDLTISYVGNHLSKVDISVLNITGAIVRHQEMQSTSGRNLWKINMNHLSAGLYLIRIQTDAGVFSGKVILED